MRRGSWTTFAVGAVLAILILAAVAVSGGAIAASVATDAPEKNSPSDDDGHPNVEDGLLESETDTGTQQSSTEAVRVVVEARAGKADAAERATAERGTIESRHERLIQATVPQGSLEGLAEESSVRYVRSPTEATQQGYTSEGVETIRADLAQDRGYRGENVTVVVIDQGFDPSHAPIVDNIIHTNDTTGQGMAGYSGDTTHGDASAEIVADVAPDVNLVLVTVRTGVETLNAISYVENNEWGENGEHLEIDAVSMSLGFPGGFPNDGTAIFDRYIDASVANGTPWFVSAGNEAGGNHWNGTFQDTDDNDFHEFANGVECNPVNGPLDVRLQWNDWTYSDQDYDLGLYELTDSGLELVTSSSTQQSGDQPPRERITWNEAGKYCVAIFNDNADGTADFDMFLGPGFREFQYSTPERSIVIMGTAKRATTVGAVDYSNGALQPYSSRGPTIDGRTKPDIAGPDRVSSIAYRNDNTAPDRFFGTSAAAPHAAGIAALVLAGNESSGADGTNERLTSTAYPLGTDPPNNRFGAGLVDAAAAVPPQNPTATDLPSSIGIDDENAVEVDVEFEHAPKPGLVKVALTDEDGTTVTNATALNTSSTVTTVTVDASQLAKGEVEVAATATGAFGWQNTDGFTATTTTRKTEGSITIEGQFEQFDGEAAADDTVVVYLNDEEFRVVRTDSNGAFSLDVPKRDEPYDVQYYQANLTQDASKWFPTDDTVDAFAIEVPGNQSTDLGTVALPKGHDVSVQIVDTENTPVENASIGWTDRKAASNATAAFVFSTNAGGVAESDGVTFDSLELNGSARVQVRPPADDDRFLDRTYSEELTVTGTEELTFTLERLITVEGQFNRFDGQAAADDTVAVFVNDDIGYNVVRLDSNGEFSLELLQREAPYYIQYEQANQSQDPSEWFPDDNTVDLFATEVPGNQSTDLGTVSLPEGHDVSVQVRNESNVPVENASIYWYDRDANSSATGGYLFSTNANGVAGTEGMVFEALELNGSARVKAVPPADDRRFVDQEYRENLTVTGPEDITITLEERSAVADYANEEGVVDTEGLREGIDDWRGGDVGTSLLREVIDYWRSGDTVSDDGTSQSSQQRTWREPSDSNQSDTTTDGGHTGPAPG